MDLKSELYGSGFGFKKKFGQNFITDKNFLLSLVEKSGVKKSDTVLEIGAGAGTLTAALAGCAGRVIAYEIDGELGPVLEKTLGDKDNVELRFCDFMKSEDVSIELGGDYKVVANLPYYITTPVLFRLIEEFENPPKAVSVMVQREVADRLCAAPKSKDYGALTVAIDLKYSAKKIIDVSRTMFYPVPNVDSAVVLMTRRENREKVDEKLFSRLVRGAFAMRRKTLVNNLMAAFSLPRETCEAALSETDLPLAVRGEALSTEQFIALAKTLEKTV